MSPEPDNSLRVLVTRPEPGATATAEALAALGHIPVMTPCLAIEHPPPKLPPPEQCSAILVASSQALPGLGPEFHQHPLLAVGDATALRARAAGFTNVTSAAGMAVDLAVLGIRSCDPQAGFLLLPCGAGQGIDLAKTMRRAGFMVHRRVVYVSRPMQALSPPAREVLEKGEVARALFFSSGTARRFVALVRREKLEHKLRPVVAIAISAAAAAVLRVLPFAEIRTALAPDQSHMLALLA